MGSFPFFVKVDSKDEKTIKISIYFLIAIEKGKKKVTCLLDILKVKQKIDSLLNKLPGIV